jgi:hypothetical protein
VNEEVMVRVGPQHHKGRKKTYATMLIVLFYGNLGAFTKLRKKDIS